MAAASQYHHREEVQALGKGYVPEADRFRRFILASADHGDQRQVSSYSRAGAVRSQAKAITRHPPVQLG